MTQRIESPIAVFAFSRPEHLRRTLRSLKACDGFRASDVTVFCDGPRSEADLSGVLDVRAIAQAELGSEAQYRFASTNLGLARSIIAGVSELCAVYGRVIVIEDDLEFSPQFLTFLRGGLDAFAADASVFQISGYMFDVPEFAARDRALFLPMTSTWGWATWARAWSVFDQEAVGWEVLKKDRYMRNRFNVDGVYDYFAMLRRQMTGRGHSWGIRWYWSVFRAGGVVLFPPVSLVANAGQDGSGTNGKGRFRDFALGATSAGGIRISLPNSPSRVDPQDYVSVRRAIWIQNGGWKGWIVDAIKRIARR